MSHKQGVHGNAVLIAATGSDPVWNRNGCSLPYFKSWSKGEDSCRNL